MQNRQYLTSSFLASFFLLRWILVATEFEFQLNRDSPILRQYLAVVSSKRESAEERLGSCNRRGSSFPEF